MRPFQRPMHGTRNLDRQNLGLTSGRVGIHSLEPQASMKRKNATEMFWFYLYDYGTGLPYKGTTADYVNLPPSADIAQFRKAVKAEYSDSHLKGISPSDLLVFKDKHSFDQRDAAVEKVIY